MAGSGVVSAAAGSATSDTSLVTVAGDGTVSYDRAAFDFLGGGQSAVLKRRHSASSRTAAST